MAGLMDSSPIDAPPHEWSATPHNCPSTSNRAMDITKFVTDYRESAFLVGDYNTYRDQLSRRLRIVNRKLGRATPKNAKYAAKAPVTAEDIGKNKEYGIGRILRNMAC